MQRRDGDLTPATTNTPGRSTIADQMRAHDEHVSVRAVVLAGGVRRLTLKEMFDER